ncbi:MAG: hypothetical protein ABFD45_11310, partial [Smithella sp.]
MPMVVHNWTSKMVFVKGEYDEENNYVGNGLRDAESLLDTGGCQMNKLLLGKVLLALTFISPAPAIAGVNVDVDISLPPPIIFAAPPALVVLPETYVYVVPDVDVDIFFYGGWWWRPWDGRWYRSQSYNSGWAY